MSLADVSIEYAFVPPEDRQHCVNVAIETIKSSHILRVPKSAEDRENAFAAWIARWRVKLEPLISTALRQDAPTSCALLSEQTLAMVVDRYVWPSVEEFLRSYAIRFQAAEWGRKNMGDATLYGLPVWEEAQWRVPLGIVRHGQNLGQIVLDADGNVLPHLTTTRQEITEKMRDC